MSILNGIVNELDIALRTLSDKKTGTNREYPPAPKEKNSEELSKNEKDLFKLNLDKKMFILNFITN